MPAAAPSGPVKTRPTRLAVLQACLLAACAQAPAPMVGPNAGSSAKPSAGPEAPGPRARVLLRGAVPGDDKFALIELADTAHCQGPRLLASGDARQTPAPASLAAGVQTTLDFVVLRGGKPQCGVRWTFTPEVGKTYLAQGLVVGSGCTARLLDASNADQPPQPASGVLLRTGPGQACLALDRSRPAGEGSSLIQGGQSQGEAVLMPNATARDLQGLIRP